MTLGGPQLSAGRAVGIGSTFALLQVALAGLGELLVTRTVIVAGSGVVFKDRGSHPLKGLPDEWQVFSVEGG